MEGWSVDECLALSLALFQFRKKKKRDTLTLHRNGWFTHRRKSAERKGGVNTLCVVRAPLNGHEGYRSSRNQ